MAELSQGGIFVGAELGQGSPPAIGFWHFEAEDGRFALVRQPAVPDEVPTILFYFGVYLAKVGGEWRVTGDLFRKQEIGP